MQRVIHYRIRDLPGHRLERVHAQFQALAEARTWRAQAPWLASEHSHGLFESEYLRHLKAESPETVAAGFIKMGPDETDALILTIFLRDVSAEYQAGVSLKDEDHPLAKLRQLDFANGLLADGRALEEVLAKRPVIKRVEGERILFYPPTFRLHSQGPASPQWAYALCGIRAYAPSLFEAEQEALKILRGLRHLGR